jgi:hypothetical protein
MTGSNIQRSTKCAQVEILEGLDCWDFTFFVNLYTVVILVTSSPNMAESHS